MKPFRRVQVFPVDDGLSRQPLADGSAADPPLSATLKRAIARTHGWLLAAQQADGHWVAELEGDTILESEYILMLAFLGQHTSPTASKAGALPTCSITRRRSCLG